MSMVHYDIAIIGAGPAGLFAAHTLLNQSTGKTITLVDKGKPLPARKCCGMCGVCLNRDRCDMLCGVGGGGLFSDGKLVVDLHSGGKLDAITTLSDEKRKELEHNIVKILKDHDGLSEPSPIISSECEKKWKALCIKAGLEIKHYDVLHMGTDNLRHITASIANEICNDPRVHLKTNCEIEFIERQPDGSTVLFPTSDEPFSAENIIFAVGKTGSEWLKGVLTNYDVGYKKENTYLGIRLEVPHKALQYLFDYSFDPKIWTYYNNRKVKTHCFCRHGEIVCTNYMGYPVVGGHTRYTAKNGISNDNQSPFGNFNILVSTSQSNSDVLKVLESTKRMNPNGIVAQSLFRFLHLERNAQHKHVLTPRIVEEDIRTLLDTFDSTGTIISDFIQRLSIIVPGIIDSESVVYAPALEWFMASLNVDCNMETSQRGWFAVGDGAGLSQGIVHSAATSIIAAEEICRRMKQ